MSRTLHGTNGTEIVAALAAERRAAGAIASGLALTLVVVTDEHRVDEAREAATLAASAHPCRVLVVVRKDVEADDQLDAEVQVGGHLGANESVVMWMSGRLTLHAESVVLPLLASDAPVVTWWNGEPPTRLAHDALGVLASRRVTDAACTADPVKTLRERARDYAPGDTDLAWTRTTPWRSLLASTFDDLQTDVRSGEVQAELGNPSAALLAGWLTSRLGVRVRREASVGPGITAVEIRLSGRDKLRVDRPDGYLATLSRSGMPDRQLPLVRRPLGELIAEELRRLDADQPYADALAVVTGAKNLDARPAVRKLIWRDPTLPAKRTAKKAAKRTTAKKTTAKRTAKSTTTKRTAKKTTATRATKTTAATARRRSRS